MVELKFHLGIYLWNTSSNMGMILNKLPLMGKLKKKRQFRLKLKSRHKKNSKNRLRLNKLNWITNKQKKITSE